MRRTAISVSVTLAVLLATAGCGSSGGGQASSGSASSSPAAAPVSSAAAPAPGAAPAGADCQRQTWPQPLADLRGQRLGDAVVGSALCYNVTAVTAADGHDVLHDPSSFTTAWTITAETPAPGSSVSRTTPVTLKVGKTS